jgi:6-phosphogluconolactonase
VGELVIVPDADGLARVAAARFIALASAAIAGRGRFIVALSGGSTPGPTYRLLAEEPYVSRVDWKHVLVFWGDERCVPPDHPDSNYRMAARALLDHVSVPRENVHCVQCNLRPVESAAVYQTELRGTLGEEGRFDLILLGLGTDGHTASLFPNTGAVNERERDVIAVYVDEVGSWRVTLTLRVINEARNVMFLVGGSGKAAVLARIRGGEALPAGLVKPEDGELTWLVDRDAAADLPKLLVN